MSHYSNHRQIALEEIAVNIGWVKNNGTVRRIIYDSLSCRGGEFRCVTTSRSVKCMQWGCQIARHFRDRLNFRSQYEQLYYSQPLAPVQSRAI